MIAVIAVIAASVVVGVNSSINGYAPSHRVLLAMSMVCVLALYSQRVV